jgi:hypothetical protein
LLFFSPSFALSLESWSIEDNARTKLGGVTLGFLIF